MTPRGRQRGSIALTLGLLLIALVSMLGLVEVGYLYWAHRNVQKVADLAALSGAQRLGTCSTPNGSNTAAIDNATKDNHFSGQITATCGYWAPEVPGKQHFGTADEDHPHNAVRATASLPLSPFFGFADFSGVSAKSIAANAAPMVAFSVGSQAAGIDPNSSLNKVLSQDLGTSLGLGLLNDTGIGHANLSLLDLVKNLPVNTGTLDSVLNTNIPVEEFLDIYLQTLSQQKNTVDLNLALLQQQINVIKSKLRGIPINLGQILNVNAVTSDPTKALDASVGALNMLQAAILAADSKHAVAIPSATVDVPLVARVKLMASVVEPPQIGIGGVGTTAHTAQIRLALDLEPLTATKLLGLSIAHLSLALEIAPSDATITDIACNVPDTNGRTNHVTIRVDPGLAHAGIANYDYLTNAFQNTQQSWASILADAHSSKYGGWDKAFNVSPLSLPVAKIYLFTDAEMKATEAFSHTFEPTASTSVASQPHMTFPETLNDNPTTQSGLLVSSLLGSNIDVYVQVLGILPIPLSIGDVLNAVSPLLDNLLAPILNTLIDPLLRRIGIEIGTAQVTLHSVDCKSGAQLVY